MDMNPKKERRSNGGMYDQGTTPLFPQRAPESPSVKQFREMSVDIVNGHSTYKKEPHD